MRPINLLLKGLAIEGPRFAIMVGASVVAWLLVLGFATISSQDRARAAE